MMKTAFTAYCRFCFYVQGNSERINTDSPRSGTSTLAIVTLQLSVTLRQSSALRYHDVFSGAPNESIVQNHINIAL